MTKRILGLDLGPIYVYISYMDNEQTNSDSEEEIRRLKVELHALVSSKKPTKDKKGYSDRVFLLPTSLRKKFIGKPGAAGLLSMCHDAKELRLLIQCVEQEINRAYMSLEKKEKA